MITVGEKVLVTTDNWFHAPDGLPYKAVFGTVKGVFDSVESLGIQTNRNATNWYMEVGNMTIAGCQIHYVIKTDTVNFGVVNDFDVTNGEVRKTDLPFSRIYNADMGSL